MEFSFETYSDEFRKCIDVAFNDYIEKVNQMSDYKTDDYLKAVLIGKVSDEKQIINAYYELIEKLKFCCERFKVNFNDFINPIYCSIRDNYRGKDFRYF